MKYTEYLIKLTWKRFNRKRSFAPHFLWFYSFCVFGSVTTLMAITCQHVAYLLIAAPQIGALRLLNTLISIPF